MTNSIDEYAYLWDGTAPDWVLVRTENSEAPVMPFNTRTRLALVIEDDGIREAVTRTMIEKNVPILDSLPSGDFVV
jgi:hypothetical protein